MSAFMVPATHIHALLTAGLAWTNPAPLSWYDKPMPAEVYEAGKPWGPSWRVWAAAHTQVLTERTAGRVGAMLLAENRRSVNHHYAEAEREEPYRFTRLPGTPNPATVINALACYEAQTHEHPGWHDSEAHRFCESLQVRGVGQLTRHDDTWEVTDPDIFVRTRGR